MRQSKPDQVFKASVPSFVSLAFHAAVFALIMLVPWAVQEQNTNKGLVIAATSLEQGADEVLFEDPQQDEPQEEDTTEDQEWAKKPAESLLKELADRPDTKDSVISLGAGGAAQTLTETTVEKFKISAGSQGPRFFGQGGAETLATRVVYVVDRSGSMIDTFEALIRELERSIDRLTYMQHYHVIFFSDDRPIENPPGKLLRAIKANKRKTFDFLEKIVPEGRTDPTAAMRRAFEVKPEIIFFLTDGEFSPDLLEKLRIWNRNKAVRIYTYAYVYQPGKKLLEQIAREHNGEYKFVSEDDIY